MIDKQKLIDAALMARDLVMDGWCQGAYQRDADGVPLRPDDPLVSQVCGFGAKQVAVRRLGLSGQDSLALISSWLQANPTLGMMSVWNDASGRTQQEVADSWDNTARYLKESE